MITSFDVLSKHYNGRTFPKTPLMERIVSGYKTIYKKDIQPDTELYLIDHSFDTISAFTVTGHHDMHYFTDSEEDWMQECMVDGAILQEFLADIGVVSSSLIHLWKYDSLQVKSTNRQETVFRTNDLRMYIVLFDKDLYHLVKLMAKSVYGESINPKLNLAFDFNLDNYSEK